LRRTIRLSSLAESDLIGIWQYSFERWDEGRADRYLDELDRGTGLLAENAELGAKRDDVRDGYRVLFINRHAIYYTVAPSTIHIVRVLHAQMDPDRHL
jgi:toxin ParE1/3/4